MLEKDITKLFDREALSKTREELYQREKVRTGVVMVFQKIQEIRTLCVVLRNSIWK